MTTTQSVSDPEARGMKLTTGSKECARSLAEGVRTHLPDVRIILLVRRDLVAQFGSLIKSQKTGVWGRHVGETKGQSLPTLELDRHEFAEYAIEAYQIRRILRSMQDTHEILEIEYEEVLLDGNLPTHDPLLNFVGVEPQRADWLTDRKLSPPPESYIENYQQLLNLQNRIERSLKNGATPQSLRSTYTRPVLKAFWRKATFWGQRPGYAAYRLEEALRDWMSEDRRTDS
jgi:hypothetical protein